MFFEYLESEWNETIVKLSFEVINILTKSIENESVEMDYGSFNWSEFQTNMMENYEMYKFNIYSTRILRTLYSEYLKLDYDYIRKYGCQDNPICYYTDDIPIYLIDRISDHNIFYNFLERLAQDIYNTKD
ncbi:hypothetical protein [Aliarcobacter butzleri]|uniref:hypothetical protein n=1 Tax=Aliarcobacter butzleri TaxID=28197 RepID=UPI0021B40098|nr:hypothetical protein [Aliarcobacter butzleri]MCT7567023.1 hypothetical protein [Aliarcobacter butzleri]